MVLEDHIGDICRKARIQTKTDTAATAVAAGVSESLLHEFETDGVNTANVDIASLAEAGVLARNRGGGGGRGLRQIKMHHHDRCLTQRRASAYP